MGRVKTQLVKRLGRKIYKDHKDLCKSTFEENKAIVVKFADFPSKKLRNVVTGYVTRLARKGQEE